MSSVVSPSAAYLNRVLALEGDVLSCRDKKGRKETLPGAGDTFLAFLAPPGARQLAGRKIRASGSNTGSLNYSRWGCGTRRALRGG